MNDLIIFSFEYKGAHGKCVQFSSNGLLRAQCQLGGQTFGPVFDPTPANIARCQDWLRNTGHDIKDN